MGKKLEHEDPSAQFEDHPGCMWGILHNLDYHQWHNVKRMLPHRRHGGARHARCNESPKSSLNGHETGAVQDIKNAEADYFFVSQSTKTSSTNKRSGKARIKALIAKEMSKEGDHKCQVSGFPARSRLQRTDSIHHLEPSEHHFSKINTWRHPIILLRRIADASATKSHGSSSLKAPEKLVGCNNKCNVCGTMNVVDYLGHNELAEMHKLLPKHLDGARETLVKQKLMDASQLSRDVSLSNAQIEDYMDVLDIFKVDKELFLKMRQDADVGSANHFHSPLTKGRLTKSGSFPVADMSCGRYFRPSKLKYKHNEIWSFPKGEKFLAGTRASKLVASKSSEDLCAKAMPLMDDDSAGSVLKQDSSSSSLVMPEGFNDQKRNQAFIYRFKDIKQASKHAIKENREESNHTSLDALHRIPDGCRFSTDAKEISKNGKDGTLVGDSRADPRNRYETNGSVYDLGNGRLQHVRRVSSLKESLDRYGQLFEYSFNREPKLYVSRSLKITKEVEVSSGGHGPKSFTRILSLPHLESCCSLQNEGSHDTFSSGMPIRTVVDSSINIESDGREATEPVGLPINAEKCIPLDAVVETECQRNMIEDNSPSIEYQSGLTVVINDEETVITGGPGEDMVVTMGESNSYPEQEIAFSNNASGEPVQPSLVSVLETCFQEDIACPAEFQISEGSELKPRCIYFDEPNSTINLQNRSSKDALSGSFSRVISENVENANKAFDNNFLHIESDRKNNADFNYVRDILEKHLGTWDSLDPPLNPSVGACLPKELKSSGGEVGVSCDHQLLFDLVNEVLLEIYERSHTYCPRALSSSCRIRPMPMGYHVLEEVWANIGPYLSSRQELHRSLDDFVARDLAKGDGWMNLQLETECVALELEDIIFDELLDEVICSRGPIMLPSQGCRHFLLGQSCTRNFASGQ